MVYKYSIHSFIQLGRYNTQCIKTNFDVFFYVLYSYFFFGFVLLSFFSCLFVQIIELSNEMLRIRQSVKTGFHVTHTTHTDVDQVVELSGIRTRVLQEYHVPFERGSWVHVVRKSVKVVVERSVAVLACKIEIIMEVIDLGTSA